MTACRHKAGLKWLSSIDLTAEINRKKDGEISVLEIGARAGGGHTFHPIASHVSWLNYPQWMARFYLGEAEAPIIHKHKGACYAFFHAQETGRLEGIYGLDAARKYPFIEIVEAWKQVGEKVSFLENSMERVGCIVALAETRDDATQAALSAREKISLKIEKNG